MNRSSQESVSSAHTYALDEQIGFILRKAHQRHRAIFSKEIGEPIAPTQFATLVSLYFEGPTSQNSLGRRTAMDSATVTGVVTRLLQRKLISKSSAPEDDRLSIIQLTDDGLTLITKLIPRALAISTATLAPLTAQEIRTLLELLSKIS